MEQRGRHRQLAIVLGLGTVGLIVVGAVAVVHLARRSVQELPEYGALPHFELTERSGAPFGSDQLRGQVAILELMFTSCPDACPRMDAALARLYEAFAASDRVRFVSITVDPEHDTLEVLRQYAERLGVEDDRWVFLRGPVEEVRRLAVDGLKLATGDLPMGHATRFVLVDTGGRIRGYYDALDPASVKTLRTHLRNLVRDG